HDEDAVPIRRPHGGPDQGAERPRDVTHLHQNEVDDPADDRADDDQQNHDPEYLPTVSFGEPGAALHAVERAEALDDARRQRGRPHDEQDDPGHDQEQRGEEECDRVQDGEPRIGKNLAKPRFSASPRTTGWPRRYWNAP